MSFKADQRAVRERYKLIRAKYIDKEEEEERQALLPQSTHLLMKPLKILLQE